MSDRSIIIPPSHTACPAMPCPPLRTATSMPFASKVHCGNHIRDALASDNYRWPTIDHTVPDATGGLVRRITGPQERPSQGLAKCRQSGLI